MYELQKPINYIFECYLNLQDIKPINTKSKYFNFKKYIFSNGEYFYSFENLHMFLNFSRSYRNAERLKMIKIFLSGTNCTLKEAKDFVENIDDIYIVDMLTNVNKILIEQPELAI